MFKAIYRASAVLTLFAVCFSSFRLASAQIAPGVLQSAAHTATVSGVVTQSDGTLAAGVDVKLSGPAFLSTKSDVHGTFDFISVPYGTYRIDVTSASLGAATRDSIIVKGDIAFSIQYSAQTAGGLKTIAQVSTRSVGAQINVTPASIASVTPRDYVFQGNTSWKELLNRIPGVVVAGTLVAGTKAWSSPVGGPFQAVILSINGGLPYETATTLDGMPLQSRTTNNVPGSGFDLSTLPMSAYDTADVVRGPGANAPSIVNSIGGSFVLHAPGNVEKNQFEFSASNDPYGGIVSTAKAAVRFGRLSTVISYGINNSPGPIGNIHTIAALSYAGGFYAPTTIGGQTFVDCGVPSSCIGVNPCPKFQPNASPNPCGYSDTILFSGVPASSAWHQDTGSIAMSYKVSPTVSAQVFYTGSSSGPMNVQCGAWGVTFAPGAGYTGGIVPGQYSYLSVVPGGQAARQSSSILEEKLTAYIGPGVLRLAAVQNNSFERFIIPSGATLIPNGQYAIYGMGCLGSAPANPSCPAGGTLTVFNGNSAFATFGPSAPQDSISWTDNRDLLASYAVQIGSVSHAAVSYVKSYYNTATESLGVMIQVPANSETTNELRFNFGSQISDKLSLDASWYITRATYHVQGGLASAAVPGPWNDSNFSYNAPRVGIVYRATRDIALRAAAGGGFSLPTLNNLLGSVTATPICSVGVCTVSSANLNLQPEKSFGIDVGTDIRLHHDTVLSFDAYRTNLYGQFFTTATAGTYSGSACLTPPCTLFTTEFSNLQLSRYEGITLDIRHDATRGIYWQGSLGLTRSYVVSVPSGFYNNGKNTCNFAAPTAAACTNLEVIPGNNFAGAVAGGLPPIPYASGSAVLGYRWAPGKYIDLSPTYFGNGNGYFEPAFFEFDAHAGYPLTKTVSLLATFRNITNIYGQGNPLIAFPNETAPTVAGAPYALFGIPYGPRSLIVTANVSL